MRVLQGLTKTGNTLMSWLFGFGVLVLAGIVGLIGCGLAGSMVIFAAMIVKPKGA